MRKLIVTEYVTVDGVMEDPGGGEKTGHGGWSRPFWSPEAGKFKFEELFAADALLLGRVTYEGFAKAWPGLKDEAGFADRMNNLPKYVVSTTLENPTWNNTSVIRQNAAEAVSKLKQADGQAILVAGSAQLAHLLRQHDLVDEYRLMVHPVVEGGGKRLFQDGLGATTLKLVETKALGKGIVLMTYVPDRDQAKLGND
jgi:dihydrofolate reductase